jgi:hypothetical protein
VIGGLVRAAAVPWLSDIGYQASGMLHSNVEVRLSCLRSADAAEIRNNNFLIIA